MSTLPEETIKKLERRVYNLEKQNKDVIEDLYFIRGWILNPPSEGFERNFPLKTSKIK
jgi:ABC-type phosphate/phosphonate transport system substrate-binding protein